MESKVYPLGYFEQNKYVVTLSEYNGQLLLSRHKNRTTWETQGGHIEEGETPLEAAKRELYEESGAIEFDIEPLFDYWAGTPEDNATGVVFYAKIHKLGPLPESEMAEVRCFSALPENITYAYILSVLLKEAAKRGKLSHIQNPFFEGENADIL